MDAAPQPVPERYVLQLLGTPLLASASGPCVLPGRRALALLAVLAVGGAHTRARLADLFWGELDEASARRNLRRELARLRDAGLGTLLDAAGDRIALVDTLDCDVAKFEDALARGDLDAAIARWQGTLLEGFTLGNAPGFDAWLAEQRDALARRWRDAADALASAREARGDIRGALDLRLRMVEADALLEPPMAHAMRLHELLGERAAALELFERGRRLLAQELGLEPLATTVALAERIRTSDRLAPLLRRDADAIGADAFDAPLVGREAESARLRDSAAAVLLLHGDAGVGKTRLAQECLRAHSTVLLRATEDASGAALQPVAQALAEALRRPPAAGRLHALPAAVRREAARLVTALDPEAKADARADPAAQRRFFDALGDALDALAGRGGTVLIDDLHWADEATLALVRHLAHRRARDAAAHVRIVAAARSAELEAHAGARDTVRMLEREGLLERLAIAPLGPAHTLALVRALAGADAADAGTVGDPAREDAVLFAARLQRSTAGNPYFLLETLRFLFATGELRIDERGRWTTRYDEATADYAELPVPPSVGQTVCERVDRLGEAARRVLEAAALAGDGFSLDEVQPATALSEWDALTGLERALHARVIVEARAGGTEAEDADPAAERRRHVRYRFAHDLARAALDGQLGPERRRRVHARLAQGFAARERRPDRMAFHLEGAGERAAAVAWRLRAAADAARKFAHRDALAQLAAALVDGPTAAQEFEARERRVTLLRGEGDIPGCVVEVERLHGLAATLGDARTQRRALVAQAMLHVHTGRPADALASCEQALALHAATAEEELQVRRVGGFAALQADRGETADAWLSRAAELATGLDAPERAGIDANLIHLRVSAGRPGEACVLAEAALARVDGTTSPDDRAMVLNAAMRAFEARGDRARALGCVDEAIALMRRADGAMHLSNFLANRVRVLLDGGDVASARVAQRELLETFGAKPAPRFRYAVLLRQARLEIAEGRVADAQATLDDALAAIPGADISLFGNAHVMRARLHALTGRFDAAAASADDAARAYAASAERPLIVAEAVHAWREVAEGRPGAARERLGAALGGPSTLDEFWNEHHELARCVLAAACVAEGDRRAALDPLDGVGLTPALEAMSAAVRVAAGQDRAAAERLRDDPRLPPLERALLERALGGRPPLG